MIHPGPRARTRQAILDAAITVFARNPAAPLGDVATAAGVGRTTLHRYYADRAELIVALRSEALSRLEAARVRARISDDTAGDAVRRLGQEYFDLGDVLSLLFNEQVSLDSVPAGGGCDPEFTALVARGHADGTIDPSLPADWVQSVLWAQLYAGWSYMAEQRVSRHEALRLVLHCLGGALRS
ncbi:TetR family transcriptional regulator [Actinoplanes sp. OR16]|uniref:TetR/AcrR family transcriptional regulator n=1 Tax=Actinoplanes sp. OR16 TaxID=946334 RepID=UPI000F6C92B5|nr:TetR/AcrR family transcriptional regulator [Actinoplanes sp. OR16]BBH70565.1 TetR family transcriptional regulator [Actinoplanes sp. OR16]